MAQRSATEVVTGLAVLAVTAGFLAYALGNTGHSTVSGVQLLAKFDNIGSLASGADVKIGGVAVGRVVGTAIDPQSYQAVVRFTVQPDIKLPTDSSAQISTGGLLGGAFLTLSPGGADVMLANGGTVGITQSATNLEDLLGKFVLQRRQPGGCDAAVVEAEGGRAEVTVAADGPVSWPGQDGQPVSCREKIKTLAENHAELHQVMQDAFEDAVLMGVDEAGMRRILSGMADTLVSPKRAR